MFKLGLLDGIKLLVPAPSGIEVPVKRVAGRDKSHYDGGKQKGEK